MNTAGRKRGLTERSRDTLHRPRGITLIRSTRIRWFSRLSGGGRLLLVIGGQESQDYSKRAIRFEPLRLDGSRNGQG
jgi:hypothetical protein